MKHPAAYFLFGIGFCGLLFAIARTYYMVWKSKKERDSRAYRNSSFRAKQAE